MKKNLSHDLIGKRSTKYRLSRKEQISSAENLGSFYENKDFTNFCSREYIKLMNKDKQ